jgi:hypothetical protein
MNSRLVLSLCTSTSPIAGIKMPIKREKCTLTTVYEWERSRLAMIGSDKDPMMYWASRSHSDIDDRYKNRTIIVNYSRPGQEFGCRFNCRFCSWKPRALEIGDIFPTESGLDELLSNYAGYKVTISGGGDPLFELERNINRFTWLVDAIHDRGFLVEVITKEIPLVAKSVNSTENTAIDLAIQSVDFWSLSIEGISDEKGRQIKAITDAGYQVRVSRVALPGRLGKEGIQNIIDWIVFYQKCGIYLAVIREDFNNGYTEEDAKGLKLLKSNFNQSRLAKYLWVSSELCASNLFLVNNSVSTGTIGMGK